MRQSGESERKTEGSRPGICRIFSPKGGSFFSLRRRRIVGQRVPFSNEEEEGGLVQRTNNQSLLPSDEDATLAVAQEEKGQETQEAI